MDEKFFLPLLTTNKPQSTKPVNALICTFRQAGGQGAECKGEGFTVFLYGQK
jgi:hypothetical protein